MMGTGIFGAIVGLLGTAISRWTDVYEKKSDVRAQLELERVKLENTRLELEQDQIRANTELTHAEIAARRELEKAERTSEAKVMAASYEHDATLSKADTTRLGTFVRGIIRPILTIIYSVMFLAIVYYCTTAEILEQNAEMIFAAFIEVAVAITLWWFGLSRRGK